MASTNTSSAANAGSTGFAGDDFANNLFSDLAPLLTLFGEQVTKQFLSLSIGWADNFMLAMAPLGILTIVVSAIRVTKDRMLKALVGRARETRATAEAELLSSTSNEVCELFDGNEIVRVLGVPDIKEFVYRERSNEAYFRGSGDAMVWGLREAWDGGLLRFVDTDSANDGKFARAHAWIKMKIVPKSPRSNNARSRKRDDEQKIIDKLLTSAPNIILNVPEAVAPTWELWIFAWFGILAQVAVLVFGALTTYHWKLLKAGKPVAAYGYPCTFLGTAAVSIGLLLCSHVIEGSTDESKLQLRSPYRDRILRIQRACSVSEQQFSSYALFNSKSSHYLRTSRLNDRNFTLLATIGTTLAISGFIAQFIGLRALHWSATIMQLGAMILMTGIRSYVRRGLAHDMASERIPEGEELAWFTEHVTHSQGLEILTGAYMPYDNEQIEDERYSDDVQKREEPVSIVESPALEWLSYTLPPKLEPKMAPVDILDRVQRSKAQSKSLTYVLEELPEGWDKGVTEEGREYFINHNGRTTTWVRPPKSTANGSIARMMVDQHSTLADITRWGEPQAEFSQRLVSAMLQVRDLIENDIYTKRRYAYNPYRSTAWEMTVILHPELPEFDQKERPIRGISRPSETQVRFELPRTDLESDDRDPSKGLRMNISTLLSLWMRTINKRSAVPEWRLDTPSALKRNRMMEVEMGVVPKTFYLRIVASERDGSSQDFERLKWLEKWLDTPVYRVPSPVGNVSISRSRGALGEEYVSHTSWDQLLHHHPIFGMQFSSLNRDTNTAKDSGFTDSELSALQGYFQDNIPPWCTPHPEEHSLRGRWTISNIRRDPDARQHVELPSTCTPERLTSGADQLRRCLQPDLAIHGTGTLVQNCALEIFTAFFMALTENVEALLGNTAVIPIYEDGPDREAPRSRWKNDVIDKIARTLFDFGFVESTSEGRNIIIPVLSARGLLPIKESRLPPAFPSESWREQTLDKWVTRRRPRHAGERLDQSREAESQGG